MLDIDRVDEFAARVEANRTDPLPTNLRIPQVGEYLRISLDSDTEAHDSHQQIIIPASTIVYVKILRVGHARFVPELQTWGFLVLTAEGTEGRWVAYTTFDYLGEIDPLDNDLLHEATEDVDASS